MGTIFDLHLAKVKVSKSTVKENKEILKLDKKYRIEVDEFFKD